MNKIGPSWDTNAPTNALHTTTNAHANAHANAPTNDTNARRTRPPTPPKAFVCPRAGIQPARKHGFAGACSRSRALDRPERKTANHARLKCHVIDQLCHAIDKPRQGMRRSCKARGGNRPPQRLTTVSNQKLRNSNPAEAKATTGEPRLKSVRPATDLADTVQTRSADRRTNAAKQASSALRPHDGKSQEGVLARDANHVFHTVEAVEGKREATGATPDDRRNLWEGRPDHLSKSRGVGGKTGARLIRDIPFHFRGSLSEKWAGPVSENLGSRSSASRIRSASHPLSFRGVPLPYQHSTTKPHQRLFLSHGGAHD
jgi:hypothetical protein